MEPLTSSHLVSERFARRFAATAGTTGALPFGDFVRLALYDDEVGYYVQRRARVGTARGTDFYTASTLREVFGPLVAEAAASLLRKSGAEPAEFEFVEIGAEPEGGVLAGVPHDFGASHMIPLGAPFSLPTRAVVFSNELFDAQPFSRVVRRDGAWREMGVRLVDDRLAWEELAAFTREAETMRDRLPADAPDGYTIDLPLGSVGLIDRILREPWRGVFLACDYGRTWSTLATEHPTGTARAYYAHRYADSLLDRPGEQDLTCHVCWDWLEEALRNHGGTGIARSGQEAFFVRHAASGIAACLARHPSPLSPVRSQLKQLLHPAFMGQRFEVLHAVRP
ncbi:SAM-dependent methyltransferase [Opitutales bacterium ASA1]|uniref:SAM-dependent methyltransferase n=1 Tax=Congregicoccus parvus TaxID=3081749 RepID=UPI002B2822B9|nr:SAM-dependent methyltransferase [Opitutales bacterium ASA1]